MNEHDISDRLRALAGTLPDNVGRVAMVRQRARRRRQRHIAARGAAATATLTLGIVGASVAVRSSRGDGGGGVASSPEAPLPQCVVAAPASDSAGKASNSILKAVAVITSFPTASSIEVSTKDEPKLPSPQTLTLEIDAATTFDDAGKALPARPPVKVGDTVFVVATAVDGRWALKSLGINEPDSPIVAPGTGPKASKVEAAKIAAASEDKSPGGKGIGVVTGLPTADSVEVTTTLDKAAGSQTITLVINDTTVFDAGGATASGRPEFKVGDTVVFQGDLIFGRMIVRRMALSDPQESSDVKPSPGTDVGKGVVQSTTNDSVVVAVAGGDLAGQTITFARSAATKYRTEAGPCGNPPLVAGTAVGFEASKQPNGALLLMEVTLASGPPAAH